MTRTMIIAAALAVIATTATAADYKGARNIFGQPDLSGNWTNATLTPLTRPAEYGDRAVMTPAEARKIVDFAKNQVDAGNRPTDPKLGATVTEVASSHVPMLSQPDVVIGVIRKAAAAVQNGRSNR